MHALVCTIDYGNNGISRVLQLWLAARIHGHTFTIINLSGDELWGPLATTDFAQECQVLTWDDTSGQPSEELPRADIVIAHKPFKAPFLQALRIAEQRDIPVLLSIDDPDIEVRTSTAHGIGKSLFTERGRVDGTFPELLMLRRLIRRVPRITQNPVLQRRWGGTLVPHVSDAKPGTPAVTDAPEVTFVGMVQPHKGVEQLRQAVAELAPQGFRLLVTGPQPVDAQPWETWVASNTWEEGKQMQAATDILAIPSLSHAVSRSQLPGKVCDAMLSARAVVASRIGPIPWALGDCGILVPPGDVGSLTEALATLRQPVERARLGAAARTRALRMFTPEAVAPRLEDALRQATATAAPRRRVLRHFS